MTIGRPTKYNPKYHPNAVFKLTLLGATDKELSSIFEISESTLNLWKKDYKEFSESLKKGKAEADSKVGNSLYQRACGYSHSDVHISNFKGEITITPITKHYPPDPTSMIFWLKNRRSDLWRDKLVEINNNNTHIYNKVEVVIDDKSNIPPALKSRTGISESESVPSTGSGS